MPLINLLVEAGADLTEKGEVSNTFLQMENYSTPIPGHLAKSCLHMASEQAQYDAIKYFLSKGISPNMTNKLTETPLHSLSGCFARGKIHCISPILNNGKNILFKISIIIASSQSVKEGALQHRSSLTSLV